MNDKVVDSFDLHNILLKSLTSFENAHRGGDRNRVEVLEPDFRDHVLVCLQRDLEDVSLFRLREEEEHGLGFVRGAADEDHASFRVVQIVSSARNRRPDVGLIAEVFVSDVILGAN